MAKFFIHRPVFAIVISLIIMIAGGVSLGSAFRVARYHAGWVEDGLVAYELLPLREARS